VRAARRSGKGRVLHAQRIEEPLLQECVERHPAHDLDDPGRGIDAALRVFPLRAARIASARQATAGRDPRASALFCALAARLAEAGRCVRSCVIVRFANSGRYFATGSATFSLPSSCSMSTACR